MPRSRGRSSRRSPVQKPKGLYIISLIHLRLQVAAAKRVPQKTTVHKALGWMMELAADAGPPIRATMLRALLEHTRARRRRVRRHKCRVFILTAYPGEQSAQARAKSSSSQLQIKLVASPHNQQDDSARAYHTKTLSAFSLTQSGMPCGGVALKLYSWDGDFPPSLGIGSST